MVKVVWTERAVQQLDAIDIYIAGFDPAAAQRITARLRALGESLAISPQRGRPVGSRYRELVAVRPYIIRYRVEARQVFILRVRHSARAETDEA